VPKKPAGYEHTVRVRQIANGYITSESHYDERTGAYHSTETHSESAPAAQAPQVPVKPSGNSGSLRAAIKVAKGK
jgi:hypothetical protein